MPFEKSNLLQHQQEQVRTRLNLLIARFGQAEIARRTGAAASNIHRYVREGKVPAEFCGALVAEFGVSPIWMLTGEGNVLRSDVRKPVAELGGDLLELVETMNAVSKLRLGSIAGRADARQLRELSDSMQTFDRLRDRLNRQTLPVIQTVLVDYESAMAEPDLERASGLRATAANLVRLTLDEEAIARFERVEARYLYMTGQIDRALELDSRIFAQRLHRKGLRDAQGMDEALNLVIGLRETARLRESRRIAEGALGLGSDGCESMRPYLLLKLFAAHLDLDLGDGTRALHRHFEAYSQVEPKDPTCWVLHGTMLIVTGSATWEEVVAAGWRYRGLSRLFVRFAYILEDEPRLARAVREMIGTTGDHQPEDEYEAVFARGILDLLRGRKRSMTDFDKLAAAHPPSVRSAPIRELLISLHRASWARLAGDQKSLAHQATRTDQLLQQLPQPLSAKPEHYAQHLRNLRAVRNPTTAHRKALAACHSRVQTLVGNGLRLFASWL